MSEGTLRIAESAENSAEAWDRGGQLPLTLLRDLGADAFLCPEVPRKYGGLSATSTDNGCYTATAGSFCSSLRSIMTSQGMAAWTIERFGTAEQSEFYLRQLVGGKLAAVAFTEPQAGSDLSAMATTIEAVGDHLIVNGDKRWITGATYADWVLVFGQYAGEAGAVLVPAAANGLSIDKVESPLGCRAAGHAHLRMRGVEVPQQNLLGISPYSVMSLVTTALLYGRLSVAWGCVGILRACLNAATDHARTRMQFGKTLGSHQLVQDHIAELLTGEQVATQYCRYASKCRDDGSPDVVLAAIVAKYYCAREASSGAGRAVQVLASYGASDCSVVARAYRDAKLMEIIEGTNEICRLVLAESYLANSRRL